MQFGFFRNIFTNFPNFNLSTHPDKDRDAEKKSDKIFH